MVILAYSYSPPVKGHILRKARKQAVGHWSIHQIYQVGGDASPEHDSHWDYEDRIGQARVRHRITCLSEGMKKFMVKL